MPNIENNGIHNYISIWICFFKIYVNLNNKKYLLFLGPHHGVDDDESQEESSRAQYVSANCVILTHYQGDAASVVDEHFSRALDKTSHTKGKLSVWVCEAKTSRSQCRSLKQFIALEPVQSRFWFLSRCFFCNDVL